jgi:hypothetical protein
LRHGARGHAPWLEEQHTPAIDQRRRYARGLARTWGGRQDRGAVAIERCANIVNTRIDWQRRR